MNLNVTWKIGLVIATAALAGGGFVFSQWLGARDDKIRAESFQKAHEETDKLRADEVKQLRAEIEEVKADAARKLDASRATFTRAQTPQDVATLVASLMKLQNPVTIVQPPATPENLHPAPVAQVSTEDAPAVKRYLQECEECKIKLPAAEAQLTASEREKQLLASQLVERTAERETWKNAANGGSFWQRAKHAGKWSAIGGAAVIAIACAIGHCPK